MENPLIENLFGVVIRCGQDLPDEYGKQAKSNNVATSQTRQSMRQKVNPSPIFIKFVATSVGSEPRNHR